MQCVLTLLHWQILMIRLGPSILPKTQECKLKICTVDVHWFFHAKARLVPGKTWRDVLFSLENRSSKTSCKDNDGGNASGVACSVFAREGLGSILVEGYSRSSELLAAMNHADLPKLPEITF